MAEKEKTDAQKNEALQPHSFSAGAEREYWIEDIGVISPKPVYSFFKRLFDILVSLIGLLVCAIPMLGIAIAVKVDSDGPVFYRQKRVGLNGRQFKIIKFRTMEKNAERNGPQWCEGKDDRRITRVGRFLRQTRLDELPQFFNCLMGTMSLVGPRPEREFFYDDFEKYVHGFSQRLKVKPGVTGLAQVNGGYDLLPEEKIVYDMEYIQKRSLWLDFKIIFRTVSVIFSHEGAR